MSSSPTTLLILPLLAVAGAQGFSAERPAIHDPTFGDLRLVDEIACAAPAKEARFRSFPRTAATVETIAGASCLTLAPTPGDATYVTMTIGAGKGLKAGAAYVLEVDYPEDKPRSLVVMNAGSETNRGLATGTAIDDGLSDRYYSSQPESVGYPLSGRIATWRSLFWLHERYCDIERPKSGERTQTPENGITVSIAHVEAAQDPFSAGIAVARVALYEVADERALPLKINYPPEGLPRRFSFWREEMADGCIEGKEPGQRAFADPITWYANKLKLAKFLGINTCCKDLLEFGYNQGWDSAEGGGNDWYYQSSTPDRWSRIVDLAGREGMYVLPYYEYRGSMGGGALSLAKKQYPRNAKGGKVYSNASWCEDGNVDVTRPETLDDANKLLDLTVAKFKDRAHFIGAWFRTRPSFLPVSFADSTLELFSREKSIDPPVARAELLGDRTLLGDYYEWWFLKRKAFLDGLRDHLRSTVDKDQVVLFTTSGAENSPGLPGEEIAKSQGRSDPWMWKGTLVCDDAARLQQVTGSESAKRMMLDGLTSDAALAGHWYRTALTTWQSDWGDYDMRHSTPIPDPQHFAKSDGVMLTYPYSRLFQVADRDALDGFRTASGLATVRMHPLNENELEVGGKSPFGYVCWDSERNGPYCMAAEARAMANGDPRYLGYLMGNSLARGYPEHVRAFNAAFLSLPAVPSTVLAGATGDPAVVVREYRTERHGTWYAVVNTALTAKPGAKLALPARGALSDAATGAPLAGSPAALSLDLGPCQLRALRVR